MNDKVRVHLVFRISAIAWLFGWYIKYQFFNQYYLHHIFQFPVRNSQFPLIFQNPQIASWAYFLPILSLFGLMLNRKSVLVAVSLLMLGCSTVLGLHIDSYNDMTYISSFWVALWLVWYAVHIDDHEHIRRHAPFLVKCIIGMLFLGGTVGKLTTEYWSGEAFYNLIIRQQPQYLGRFIHDTFTVDQQIGITKVISKVIIVAEGLLVLSPLYPYRFFCLFGVLTVIMIVLFRSWTILSVLACLAGIILACLLLLQKTEEKSIS